MKKSSKHFYVYLMVLISIFVIGIEEELKAQKNECDYKQTLEGFGNFYVNNELTPRVSGDVNGDGKEDIIGFRDNGVEVSLSKSNFYGVFSEEIVGLEYFKAVSTFSPTIDEYPNMNSYPRYVCDINGDGKDDIIGFHDNNYAFSLSNSDYDKVIFENPVTVNDLFCRNDGWVNNNKYPRIMGDVNGDGKMDIVGFGYNSVYISLANFEMGTYFDTPVSKFNGEFTFANGWTDNNIHPRYVADVNGDNKADIIGFKDDHYYVSISNCTANGIVSFFDPVPIDNDFCTSDGFTNNDQYPRMIADFNNDGNADIIGFGYGNVYVSLSNCSNNTVSYGSPFVALNELGYCFNQGWVNSNQYPRYVKDINHDGYCDIIGFGYNSTFVSYALPKGNRFSNPDPIVDMFATSQNWTNQNSTPRLLADINNDGSADIVGFKDNYVYTYTCFDNEYPFVYIGEDSRFYQNNELYDLKAMNYLVDFYTFSDPESMFVVPDHSSASPSSHSHYCNSVDFTTQEEADIQIEEDLENLKANGFNVIRLVGFGYPYYEKTDNFDEGFYYRYFYIDKTFNPWWNQKKLTPAVANKKMELLEGFLEICERKEIKVILLMGGGKNHKVAGCVFEDYGSYLSDFINREDDSGNLVFANDPTILAIDFQNEPGRFYGSIRNDKEKNSYITKYWNKIIKDYAPNILTTIGLQGFSDLSGFDYHLMNVDFISSHLYYKEETKYKFDNYLYWMSQNIEVPWIIGETGYSAYRINNPEDEKCSPDEWGYGDEEAQRLFAEYSIQRTRNCGGQGFSWWLYKDICSDNGGYTNQSNMGLVTRCGRNKPAINEFIQEWYDINCQECIKPNNELYYNTMDNYYVKIIGTVLDKNTNSPISGAFIVGKDYEDYSNQSWTISKDDGSFELFYPFDPNIHDKINIEILGLGYKESVIWEESLNGGGELDISGYSELKLVPAISADFVDCKKDEKPLEFKTSIGEMKTNYFKAAIYPNPAKSIVYIKLDEELSNAHYSIYSINGKCLSSGLLKQSISSVDVSSFSKGTYYIKIESSKVNETHKVIISSK